jgi:hypothetical protein
MFAQVAGKVGIGFVDLQIRQRFVQAGNMVALQSCGGWRSQKPCNQSRIYNVVLNQQHSDKCRLPRIHDQR